MFFCDDGGGLVVGGGALLVGGGSVCDDLGGVSTGDEVMLTSHPVLAHCAPPLPPLYPPHKPTLVLDTCGPTFASGDLRNTGCSFLEQSP